MIRAYDLTLAPLTQLLVYRVLGIGTLFYGGNFAVRRDALDAIGGFDTAIEFHGEDTNLGRRLVGVGKVSMAPECWLYTSARRYRAMGKRQVVPSLRPQLLVRDRAPPAEGPAAPGREDLTCPDTNRFCSATSTCTRAGATAASACARRSISTAGPGSST